MYTQSHKVLPKSHLLEDQLFARIEETPQRTLLDKARMMIEAKRQTNPTFFEDGRKKLEQEKLKQRHNNKGTFMITAVNTMPTKSTKLQEPQPQVPEEPTMQEMLQDVLDQKKDYDDLAELRRMIIETDANLQEYAGGMHKLNRDLTKYNQQARKQGMGIKDDAIFDTVDKKLTKYLVKSKTQAQLKQKQY